jgi:hypothetical protein
LELDVSPEIEHESGKSGEIAAAYTPRRQHTSTLDYSKEKNDPLRPLRPNPQNLRITYDLFNCLRERMFLGPLCVGIGRGADDVLDLREGDAVVYESGEYEGCLSPNGMDWTADDR